ncbi:hypothetical protein CYMTET_4730 [Cymbomonas tetramitiformis]|uniref:Uncharacterized protein n=1 Tax=Cymbomonas tetramitiformis TaxID=36881 RepID=A0AAE0LJL5_9CHLO|nr:hypothetical protein CYMTET_4730 [Cymbomonas tetramitiformis]
MSTTYGDPWTLPAYFPPPPPPVYGADPASEARAREWWAARERMAAAERAVATDMRVVPQRLYPTPPMEPTPHIDTSPDEGVVNHQPHHRRRASGPETLGRTLPTRTEPQDVVTEDLSQAHASQPGSTTSGSGYESAAGTQHSRKRRERRLKLEKHRRKELTDQEMLQRVVRAETARFLAETEAGSLRDQMAQLEATTPEGEVAEERRLARRRRASMDTPVVYGSGEGQPQHAAGAAEHATSSADHATQYATQHATPPAEHATRLAEHATRPAEHATRLAHGGQLALGWKDGKPLAADEESQSRNSDYKDTEDDPGDDPGDGPDALKICDNLGLSPARYILSGAGSSTSFPEIRPLHTTEASTYALLVDRLVAEESIRGTRRSRIPSQWYQCPRRPVVDAFTESKAETYELDGLQAWVEVCAGCSMVLGCIVWVAFYDVPTPVADWLLHLPGSFTSTLSRCRDLHPDGDSYGSGGTTCRGCTSSGRPDGDVHPDDRSYQTAIKNESSLLKDIYKLVDDLPEFPGDHYTKGRAMDDLEEFSVAVNALLEHMTVIAALTTPSFRREAQGRNQLSVSTLLWMIKTAKLAKAQKLYVEEMAPGGSEGEAWKARYAAVPRFMGDLALSVVIATDALKRLKSELLSTRQRSEEKTGAFYTRITTRTATVNFVTYVQVGSKLADLGLDTSHPEQWEDEQRRLGRSDTSAILKVRSVATEIETAKVMEDAVLHDTIARKVALEMGHRQRLEHLVANCTDEKKLAIWKANAPARLARRPGQVAACVEVIEERVEEDSLNPEELETMEEILALADDDVDLYLWGSVCHV